MATKTGRPSKYNKAILEKSNKYIEVWKTLGDMIPSVEALSEYINISRSTIYKWERDKISDEFSHMLDNISRLQKRVLINNGLSGEFNAAITKLVLTKHGLSDKVDSDVTSGGKEIKNEWHIHPVQNAKD